MFSLHQQIGSPAAEYLARARPLSKAIMQVLNDKLHWHSAIEQVSVYAAVERCIMILLEAGETDDEIMKSRVIRLVCSDDLRRPHGELTTRAD